MSLEPQSRMVDVAFAITGSVIPADHGYHLFSALSRVLPAAFHEESNWFGVHPIRGVLIGNRSLSLSRKSHLIIRTDASRIPMLLALSGQTLRIDAISIQIGVPAIYCLTPANTLASRIVTIKGFKDPEPFCEAARRHFLELGISGRLNLATTACASALEGRRALKSGSPIKRTLTVKNREIVGFAVSVTDLSETDSITLQSRGLGGRRHFGCGIFCPLRSSYAPAA